MKFTGNRYPANARSVTIRCFEQTDYEAGNGHIYRVSNAWSMFDKLSSKFGFSPTERTKLAIEPPPEDDPFEEWLKANRDTCERRSKTLALGRGIRV